MNPLNPKQKLKLSPKHGDSMFRQNKWWHRGQLPLREDLLYSHFPNGGVLYPHKGPHDEAPVWSGDRSKGERKAWPRAFMGFLCSTLGQARQGRGSGLGLASLNNCLGLRAWGLFLVVLYRRLSSVDWFRVWETLALCVRVKGDSLEHGVLLAGEA